MSSRQLAYIQKRRSTRIYNSIPLAVQGSDAYLAPYRDQVSTLTVNCHGCRYQSKHEVIQGDVVYLEVKLPNSDSSSARTCEGRVKWVHRLITKDPAFEIAVELKSPGNIWGIASPPEDWFPAQTPGAAEQKHSQPEKSESVPAQKQLAPATKTESNHAESPRVGLAVSASALSASPVPASPVSSNPAPPSSLSVGQIMAGLGEQIQAIASHAAKSALVQERERLIVEFRKQLQDEATRTLDSVIAASKEELTRRALKELSDVHEASARTTYERWSKKIEEDSKNAGQYLLAQGVEVTRRVEGMTASTIERLQRNMDACRQEAVDRFVARLREQVAPMLEGAQGTLQSLTAAEDKLKTQSQVIRDGYDNFLQQVTQKSIAEVREKTLGMLDQFESSVMGRLARSHEELHERSAEVVAETTAILRKLSEGCEASVQSQLQTLVATASDHVTKILKQKTAQISDQFSTELEGNTRSYLESISESIAAIPKKTVAQSGE